MTLPKHQRSGVTPDQAVAPPVPIRKPVMTSSKISSAPAASHAARKASQEAGGGRHEVHVGRHRLDNDAGHLGRPVPAPRCRAATTVSATAPLGHPDRSRQARAWPPRSRPRPGARRSGRDSSRRTSPHDPDPSTPRARRTALMAASVPDETSRTCSQPGTRSQIASARSTSPGVGAPKVVPSAAALARAAVTTGCA